MTQLPPAYLRHKNSGKFTRELTAIITAVILDKMLSTSGLDFHNFFPIKWTNPVTKYH